VGVVQRACLRKSLGRPFKTGGLVAIISVFAGKPPTA
jgi:hypothetical protein